MEVVFESRRPHADPGELLGRLVPGDPLQIVPLVAERLRARALFLDARQVALRVCATLALEGELDWTHPRPAPCTAVRESDAGHADGDRPRDGAPRPSSRPGSRSWRRRRRAGLERVVESTLDELVDGGDALAESDTDGPTGAPADFARSLGLAPEEVRRGLTEFHRLPLATRRLFRELVVERRPLRSLAAEFDRPAVELLREVRSTFAHLLPRNGSRRTATTSS